MPPINRIASERGHSSVSAVPSGENAKFRSKNRSFVVTRSFVVVLTALLATGIIWLLAACTSATPPPSCELASLLLDSENLPPGMTLGHESSPVADSTQHSISRSFSSTALRVGQAVFWYPEIRFAERKYQKEANPAIGWPGGREETQPSIDLDEVDADESYLDCGSVIDGPACILVARYGVVVTWLNIQFPDGEIQPDLIRDLAFQSAKRITGCSAAE